MSLYIADGAQKVWLERWSIRESNGGTRHFVGYDVHRCDGRVSTPIKDFDAITRKGTTASGSNYRLLGRAGRDSDAEYVWRIAAKGWGIETWKDVTADVVADWRVGLPLTDAELNEMRDVDLGE